MGRLLGNPGVQLGRHAQLRHVPVPLADLPDHPRPGRSRSMTSDAVGAGDGASRCRSPRPATATSKLPIRQGRLGEWMRGDRRPRTAAAVQATTTARRVRCRQRRARRLRRRQHRHGRQPLRRPDRVRQLRPAGRSTLHLSRRHRRSDGRLDHRCRTRSRRRSPRHPGQTVPTTPPTDVDDHQHDGAPTTAPY